MAVVTVYGEEFAAYNLIRQGDKLHFNVTLPDGRAYVRTFYGREVVDVQLLDVAGGCDVA